MTEEKQLIRKVTIIASISALAVLLVLKFDVVLSGLKLLLDAASPLIFGIIIALVLDVPLRAIEGKLSKKDKKERIAAVILTYLLFILLITLALTFIVPQFYDSIVSLVVNLSKYIGSIEEFINSILIKLNLDFRVDINSFFSIPISDLTSGLSEFIGKTPSISEWLQENVPSIFSNISNITIAIVGFIVSMLLALFFSIYILSSKEKYVKQMSDTIDALLPEKIGSTIKHVAHKSYEVFSGFVGGQLAEMLILGSMFFLTLSITGMPYALLISVVIALTSIIPYFGTTLAMVFGAILILADAGLIRMIIFIIIFVVIQQVENNLIYPHVVGNSVGLPPIWVLFAVTIFGDIFGVVGLLIAVPLMAIIYTLFREYVYKRLASKNS